MDSRLLAAFVAIAEERHFGRAAARLRISQPALSQQLRKLETIVGVRLVHRTTREVSLTPAGRRFEPDARAIEVATRRAIEVARNGAADHDDPIRVGYNLVAARRYLPRAMSALTGTTPTLIEMRSGSQLAALERGDLDVALFYGPAPAYGWIDQRQLGRIELGVIVGPRHQLWSRRSVRIRELARQPCVLHARETTPAMYDTVMAAAAAGGINLDVRHVTDDPVATAHLVATAPLVGFASLDRGAALREQGSTLRAIRLDTPAVTLPLCAAWRAHDTHPARDRFLATI